MKFISISLSVLRAYDEAVRHQKTLSSKSSSTLSSISEREIGEGFENPTEEDQS